MYAVIAGFCGLLFGFGLILSDMVNPAKVQAFLDLAGAWDPSLGLVMAGAIMVALPGFWLLRGKKQSLLALPMQVPTRKDIDKRLVLGSITFGVGWGIAGLCPGPALVSLGAGAVQALIFIAAMLAGMGIYQLLENAKRKNT